MTERQIRTRWTNTEESTAVDSLIHGVVERMSAIGAVDMFVVGTLKGVGKCSRLAPRSRNGPA